MRNQLATTIEISTLLSSYPVQERIECLGDFLGDNMGYEDGCRVIISPDPGSGSASTHT
jgi:hypothetical protein